MVKEAGGAFTRTRNHFLRDLNLQTVLEKDDSEAAFTGVKVVATIGPSTQDVEALTQLLASGVVGARVDLTWGPLDFHRKSLSNLQVAMQNSRRLCCTMVDTLGRELMIRRQVKMDENGWPVHEEDFVVTQGQQVTLTTRLDVAASANVLPITYERFTEMTEPGDTVYIGRYLVCGADSASLYLEVQEVNGPDVICVAKNDAVLGGLLTVFHAERSSDELLNLQNALPLLSDYDKEAIKVIASEFEIDFISLSYTRCAEDVREARAYLASLGCTSTRILAKVETRQSLLNFQGILNEADGIIVSRGNLGLDCQPEKMALVQKTLIQACNMVGKPCLITRVVDTMVNTPRPTRAEATDVANAVLDGVDGILLGAETLRGRYPLDTVRTICSICRAAEAVFDHTHHYDHLMEWALEGEEEELLESGRGSKRVSAQDGVYIGGGMPKVGSGIFPPPSENGAAGGDDGLLLHVSPTPSGRDLASMNGHGNGYHGRPSGMPSTLGSSHRLSHMSPAQGGGASSSSLAGRAGGGGMTKVGTWVGAPLSAAAHAMADGAANSSYANLAGMMGMQQSRSRKPGPWRSPWLSKQESIASSAVRAADKVAAKLILVFTHTGGTAQLVSKYRPPMPILTMVVPELKSNGLTWKLEGRGYARQCLLTRGLLPMLVAPSAHGDQVLEDAVQMASRMGLVGPQDHVVCVQRIHQDFSVKVMSVDDMGQGIKKAGLFSATTTLVKPLMPPSSNGPSTVQSAGSNGAVLPPAVAPIPPMCSSGTMLGAAQNHC